MNSMNNSNPAPILRYPSPNIKISKKESIEKVELSNSCSKSSAKEPNILQMSLSQSQRTNENPTQNQKNHIENNDSMCSEKNKFTCLLEKLNNENNTLKKKLEGFEEKMANPRLFKNTDQVLDFKGFIKSNMDRFSELLNELYNNKTILENEATIIKKMQKQIEENKNNKIKKGDTKTKKMNSLADKKEKLEKQLINSQEELASLKEKHNNYKDKMNKRDFFTEYDKICKEVDELRKTNYLLTETLKKYIPVQES